jgi:hypothetical protein
MKTIVTLALMFAGINALAASPNGTYYTPETALQDGYIPEKITVIADGQMTDYSVFNGAKAVISYGVAVDGNSMTLSVLNKENISFNCNGHNVTFDTTTTSMTVQFERRANSLVLNMPEAPIVLTDATAEQKAKILSLPDCTKQ